MTKLDDYITRAQTFIRDSAGRFVTEEDYAVWANEAVSDLAARLKIFEKEVTGLIWNGFAGELDMPPDANNNPELFEIVSLFFGDDEVRFVSSSVFDDWRTNPTEPTTTIGRVFENKIEVLPLPAEGVRYYLRYKQIPVPMVSGGDISPLPTHLDRKVVAWMVAMGLMKSGEDPQNALLLYEQGLPQVASGREKILPGPMVLVPELHPIELDEGFTR